ARGRVVVEDHGDQGHRQDQATRDPPAQFEPHRIKIDFLAQALSLRIATIKIVRHNGEKGAEKKLKHASAPFFVWTTRQALSRARQRYPPLEPPASRAGRRRPRCLPGRPRSLLAAW